MIRQRLGRFATVFTSAALALTLLGVGTAGAANPSGWGVTFVQIPNIVAAGNGNDAGYQVTVFNTGPSQINGLTMTVTAADTPAVGWSHLSLFTVTNTAQPVCGTTVPLTCQLGTFVAGASVTFTIAYPVAAGLTGTFDVDVALRASTGDTSSDHGNNSRGDAKTVTSKTPISSSSNFDGGFVVGTDDYATGGLGTLGRQNKQNTALVPPGSLIPVTIEDGITTGVTCDPDDNAACNGLFGEWSILNVNNGASGAPFKTTLFVWGGAVPGGVQAGDVQVVHILPDGTVDVISDNCTFAGLNPVPTNVECITPIKVGANWKIDVWLFANGPIRGGV